MKTTLGGKLSIFLASIVTGVWAVLLFVPDLVGTVQEYGPLVLFILSFPLAHLSGMFSHTDSGPPSELYIYLALLIPNVFVLGYSAAGVCHVVRRVFRSSRPGAEPGGPANGGQPLSPDSTSTPPAAGPRR